MARLNCIRNSAPRQDPIGEDMEQKCARDPCRYAVNAPASSTTIYVGKKDIPQGLSNILLFWMLHPLILSHVVDLFLFFPTALAKTPCSMYPCPALPTHHTVWETAPDG